MSNNPPAPRFHLTGHRGQPRYRRRWVVLASVDVLRPGCTVDVERRDETVTTVTVARVGRPFNRDGHAMAYGYPVRDDQDEIDQDESMAVTTGQDDRP